MPFSKGFLLNVATTFAFLSVFSIETLYLASEEPSGSALPETTIVVSFVISILLTAYEFPVAVTSTVQQEQY